MDQLYCPYEQPSHVLNNWSAENKFAEHPNLFHEIIVSLNSVAKVIINLTKIKIHHPRKKDSTGLPNVIVLFH